MASPAAFSATANTTATAKAFGNPVSSESLAHNRGGHAINFVFNNQSLQANMSDNQASDNLTGMNVISGHAFAGASGVPTVIQNSGNNVIIQNATILNIQVR